MKPPPPRPRLPGIDRLAVRSADAGSTSGEGAPEAGPAPGFRRHGVEHPGWGRVVAWVSPSVARPATPPLVLLHGFTGSAAAWGVPLLAGLSGTRTVVAVDLPGHGASDWPGEDQGVSVPALAALLAEALPEWLGGGREGGGEADWLGYSMGARIALAVAVLHPGVVRRLILESGSPGLPDEAERKVRREADEGLAEGLERDGIAPFVERWLALPLFAGLRALPAGAFRDEQERRLANRPRGLAGALRRLGTGTQPDFRGALHTLDIPTLLMAGGADAKFAHLAREMEARLPRARRVEWPDVGHVPHRELPPERWLEVVESFLGGRSGTQPPPISSRKASP